jgi:integrase
MPAFGTRPLASITPSDVRAFVLSLTATGKAPATVRKSYNVLTSVMSAAVTEGLIGRTPCVGAKLPAVQRREMRFLTADELQALAGNVGERYVALVLLAGYVGLRWGETAGLRRERLRLLEKKLDIVETLIEIDGGRLESGPPKTGNRTVTLPGYVVEVLAEHMARFPSDIYIFTSPAGAPLRRRNFGRRVFAPAVERTRLSPLRWHDLRHTAAALAIASGAHPKAIQERLGHSSIQVTLDVYGHLFPSLEETLAERLDEVARGAAAAYLPPARRVRRVLDHGSAS